jgi:hypothetical protein
MSKRPGPATLAVTFTDAREVVDMPLPVKAGTTRLTFVAPPWDD